MNKWHSSIVLSDAFIQIRKFRKEIVKFEIEALNCLISGNKNLNFKLDDVDYLTINTQNLINQLLNNQKLSKQIISSIAENSNITYPIPKEWGQFFCKNIGEINKIKSNVMWKLYLLKKFVLNIISLARLFILDLITILLQNKPIESLSQSTYLHDFEESKMSSGFYNFPNWCFKIDELRDDELYHANRNFKKSRIVKYRGDFFMPSDFRSLLLNIFRALAGVFLLVNKYGLRASVFVPFKEMYILLNLENKNINNSMKFIFLDSNRLSKPLWAIYLERMSARVIYIETSQSIEPLDFSGNILHDDFDLILQWKEIWTVSRGRESFYKNLVPDNSVCIKNMGLPWISDLEYSFENTLKPVLSIFDVEPHLNYFGWSTYNLFGVQTIEFALKFLQDILSTSIELDVIVFHKPKRHIGSKRYPQYSHQISSFLHLYPNNYYVLDSKISPQRVAKFSDLIVATPFTSALLASTDMTCPRIYYDPLQTGMLPDQEIDFQIIPGKVNLKKWMIKELASQKGFYG